MVIMHLYFSQFSQEKSVPGMKWEDVVDYR
jgi:hypothetical protein